MSKEMTIKQAQRKCRVWRAKGDPASLRKAAELEGKFVSHPDYESDAAWLLRVQAGPQT